MEFPDADIGALGKSRWTTWIQTEYRMQIISVDLFNFAYVDSVYAEEWVHIIVKSVSSMFLILKYSFQWEQCVFYLVH